jgi:chromate transporter
MLADMAAGDTQRSPAGGRALEVLGVATRLGLTSFGGPVAHLGYFREEYVARRRWLTDRAFADLVALCQFLPGPASSQVGIGVGLLRAGYPGSLLAWIGFTLPSVVLLVLFAWIVRDASSTSWLDGLEVVAVAVVAWAVWGMARMLTPDRQRLLLAIAAAIFVLSWATPAAQVVAIVVGGLIGWRFLTAPAHVDAGERGFAGSKGVAVAFLAVFAFLLALLPILSRATASGTVDMIDGFYRAGSLVFGGGHVVLPLLEAEVVRPGWVSSSDFVAGYGAAQAVPGPLFTFAAYLGFVMTAGPGGVAGAAIATIAIFLPSFLLVFGALPFWNDLRHRAGARSALAGVNAAVVGLLLAALYDPVWTSAIHDAADFALALGAFGLLAVLRLPAWLVVLVTGLVGAAMAEWG